MSAPFTQFPINTREIDLDKFEADVQQTSDKAVEALGHAEEAKVRRDQAEVFSNSASDDATQTALDRIATGEDAVATAADRVQTGLDRTAAETAKDAALSAYQGRQYTTRAAFVADTAYVNGVAAPADGTVVFAGGLQYVRSEGATVLPGLVGWLPFGAPYPEHFGAVSYGSISEVSGGVPGLEPVDAYPAIKACYDYIKTVATADANGKGRFLNFYSRKYRVTQTLVIDATDITVNCPQGAMLYVDHVAGAGVWIQQRVVDLGRLTIRGSATRAATMNKANMGVRIEPENDDTLSTSLVTQIDLSRATISHHGGSGVVANSMSGLSLMGSIITDNRRHGVVVCNYAETDRVNARSTGMVDIGGNCRIERNRGHRLLIGAKSGVGTASAYRINIYNIDGGHSDVDPEILLEPTLDFIRSADVNIMGGAFNPNNYDGSVTLAGRSIVFDGSIRIVGQGETEKDHYIFVRQYSPTNRTQDVRIGAFQCIESGPSVSSVFVADDVDAQTVFVENNLPINQPVVNRPVFRSTELRGGIEFGASPFQRDLISGVTPMYLPDSVGASAATGDISTGRVILLPVHVPSAFPINRVQFEVTTAGTGNARVGIYAHDASSGRPAELLRASGEISTATTGLKNYDFVTALTGWRKIWVAITVSETTAVRRGVLTYSGDCGAVSLTVPAFGLEHPFAYAALPATMAERTLNLTQNRLLLGVTNA